VAVKAQVSFSLMQIPVRVQTMTSEQKGRVSFRNLHSTCLTPINEQKVCRVCEVDVEVSDLVKGFEVTKGNFVTFTEEEVDQTSAARSPLIEITKFVPAPDPMWVDREYWLPPENPDVTPLARTYATFCDALERSGNVGIGKAALWGKERPVTVSARMRMLTLQVLHTQAEFNEAPLPCAFPVDDRELSQLLSLIKEYEDGIEESDVEVESDTRIKELVAAKVGGTVYVAPEPVAAEPPTVDLLETLRQIRALKTPAKRAVTKKKVSA